MILLGVPLVCQFIFGAVLIFSLAQSDAAGKREARNKEVVAACQVIRALILEHMQTLGAGRLLSVDKRMVTNAQVRESIEKKANDVLALCKDDPEAAAIANDYVAALKKFEDVVEDPKIEVAGLKTRALFARFLNEREYLEELMNSFKEAVAYEDRLLERFKRVEKDLAPESLQSRENWKNVVILGAVVDTALVIALGVLFSRNTLSRLDILMDNIRAFARGEAKLRSLSGSDELAELDENFREMADARNNADEMRRSLLAMVSHDLRTPLTSVGLTLSVILETEKKKIEDALSVKLRRMNSEIDRLVRLASSLLEIERIESNKVELNFSMIPVESLISASMNAVMGMSETKSITVDPSFDPDQNINCDSERIIQVLVNLLSNSLKFSPKNSTVKINVRETNRSFKFEVIDQGPGVSPEDEKKLFQKFSQLQQLEDIKKMGSGLGLYIASRLVTAHGGLIGYNRVEGGSCFWFELPLNPEALQADGVRP